jgi:probable HAF family extracellular repeat protein
MKRSILFLFSLLAFLSSANAQFKYTPIDFPGGTLTTARGINNHGEIVGAYRIVAPRHALLIKAGQYIPLAPTTVLDTNYSEALKSNDRGDVIGQFIGDDGSFHGFFLHKGAVTTLDFPGASDTYPMGINDSGTVVGYWDLLDADGNTLAYHGFVWKNGSFDEMNFPGSGDSAILGINARGDLVGAWDSGITSTIGHGFVCSKGQCFSVDVPIAGAIQTQVDDINANGEMTGAYIDADGVTHAFLMVGSKFTSFEFPGATSTLAWGINSAGEVVGTYHNADGSTHGFLAQPR